MNKQDIKFHLKSDLKRLENSVLRVIAVFPPDKNWDMRHVHTAVTKLVENPELSTEEVITKIKMSYLCVHEGWLVDKGDRIINNPCCKDSIHCKQGKCSNWLHCMARDEL